MAAITDLLELGHTFSFELMPATTSKREAQLAETLVELEALRPSFATVTYGAGGSTRDKTHELVRRLLKTTMSPMAHLTCEAQTRAELTELVTQYRNDGLENILALHGDPPLERDESVPEGELKRATELVELIRGVGDFTVAVAAHPEGHPHSPDKKTDRERQATKIKTADLAITQFFFRADDYFRFVDDMTALGATQPIIPGLLLPTSIKQLDRMADMSGADIPWEVTDRMSRFAGDPDALREVGVETITKLAQELLEQGVPGLHFYTMNRAEPVMEIYENLGLTPTRT